jgi:uncharacterized protein YwqG
VRDDLQEKRLRELITQFRLASHTDAILATARNSIRLRLTDYPASEDETRLGGSANLPAELPWPSWKNREQALIAQIMLRDVVRFDLERALPRNGRLLFFYDSAQETWGFDPGDRGSWTVLFIGDAVPTTRRSNTLYTARRLEPSAELSIPPWESLSFQSFGFSEAETSDYVALCGALRNGDELATKMLGYPEPVQGAMEEECQLASNGIYCGNADSDKDPRAASLKPGAADWRLLLQVDSEEAIGMMWGDVGRLYYWIRDEDLRSGNFAATWFVLQCC